MKHKHDANGRHLRWQPAPLLHLKEGMIGSGIWILLLRSRQSPRRTANMMSPAGICMSNLPPHIRQKLAVSFGFGGRTASACVCVTQFTSGLSLVALF